VRARLRFCPISTRSATPTSRDTHSKSWRTDIFSPTEAAAYAAAWAAGQALTLEQAIAQALRVAPAAQPAARAIAPITQPVSATPDRLGTLTPRERQVLALLAQGASNRAIADTLVIAERTAGIHVSNILGKLGVTSRTQAAAYALAQGLTEPPGA
jgi:DNA-binding NarL/FixJ family response regulator